MASDTFGFLVDQNTLIAVILGAILATIGGFVATMLERYLDKRERERNAALFFGEVLSTLPPNRFLQIHRSTIVNIERVRELQPWFHGEYVVILLDGTSLKLSRTHRDALARLIR